MDDYLEKLFADAYGREVEQEENIVRSLPIIAAIASVTLLVLREFGDGIPGFDWSPLAFLLHGLIIAIGATFLYVLVFLFVALRPRQYEHPKNTLAIRAIADGIVDFYELEGLDGESAEAMALHDLRQQMIDQFAFAAANNREQNRQRQRARSRAFNGLVAALTLAFVLVGTIYSVQITNAAALATAGVSAAE